MLHELLLSLSGHPSPLLKPDGQLDDAIGTLISPSERSLLRKLAKLGNLHNSVRARAASVNSSHPSVVCKAVAACILETYLARYQDKIIEVEKSILHHDSKFVAAYNAVPLSTIVVEFDGWTQIFAWLEEILKFIEAQHEDLKKSKPHRSGAEILNDLQGRSRTGYPDLKEICLTLIQAAEAAWLRQLSSWLLYGKLPTFGAEDFFIKATSSPGTTFGFYADYELAPAFVTKSGCDSILSTGQSVIQIDRYQTSSATNSRSISKTDLMPFLSDGLEHLSSLESPISTAIFSRSIQYIRLSLARNVLQKLLPTTTVLKTLRVIHEFMLLQRGEFALALIANSDQHLANRKFGSDSDRATRMPGALGGAMIKEAEVTTVMNKTWASLAAFRDVNSDIEDEYEDEELDAARDIISLEIVRSRKPRQDENQDNTSNNAFQDLLLGTPTALNLALASPLDMFLSSKEAQTYSDTNSVLLSIRRAHLHLTNLWKLSVLRRTHPGPTRPVNPATQPKLEADRKRARLRNDFMRGVWATTSVASLSLVELGEYFQGEVVASSWSAFQQWIEAPSDARGSESPIRDPETLAIAHRKYLSALTRSLLLHDQQFVRRLRQLLGRVDHLVGLVHRLEVVVKTLMAGESVNTTGPDHLRREENSLRESLRIARTQLNDSLSELVQRLNDMEEERLERDADALNLNYGTQHSIMDNDQSVFTPWQGASISNLTMKLEFARSVDGRALVPG